MFLQKCYFQSIWPTRILKIAILYFLTKCILNSPVFSISSQNYSAHFDSFADNEITNNPTVSISPSTGKHLHNSPTPLNMRSAKKLANGTHLDMILITTTAQNKFSAAWFTVWAENQDIIMQTTRNTFCTWIEDGLTDIGGKISALGAGL